MRSLIPDRERRGDPAASRRPPALGAALAAIAGGLAMVALSAALAGQNSNGRGAARDTARSRDAAPPGDLRCLTRRVEDCLPAPVPRDEPHGAVCATCHSLWQRGNATGTIQSCSGGECHLRPETLTPFHRTVSGTTLADCTSCHAPHSFRAPEGGAGCSACHEGGGRAAAQAHAAPVRHLPQGLAFPHDEHALVSCVSCHASRDGHGTVKVTRLQDCRSCHHDSPVADDCVSCHARDEVDSLSFTVTRKLDIRIGSLERPARTLVFEHARHATASCTTCHIGANLEATAATDCSSCHFEHHAPTADCLACHERPAEGAHDRRSHLGCGGTACHDPAPAGIRWAPRTRSLCLACHSDRVDHKPDGNCADCHVLPPPGGPATGAVSTRPDPFAPLRMPMTGRS